jgi:hypothetical protein
VRSSAAPENLTIWFSIKRMPPSQAGVRAH